MRHGISGKKLGRSSSWRKATVRDIAKATLVHERVCTTLTKAKEARKLVDRLVTLGKKGTLAHSRKAFSILCDHKIVSNLFSETAPRFRNRVGGYTRIIPLSVRRGDNAQLAYLELTEKKKIIVSKTKSSATSKKDDLKVKSTPAEETEQTEVKNAEGTKKVKTDVTKAHPTKADIPRDKGKASKKASGLRNIFRRKTAE